MQKILCMCFLIFFCKTAYQSNELEEFSSYFDPLYNITALNLELDEEMKPFEKTLKNFPAIQKEDREDGDENNMQYSWMLPVYSDNEFACGAVAIAESILLTTASCAEKGKLSVLVKDDHLGKKFISLNRVVLYPKWGSSDDRMYNIAILETTGPVPNNETWICIPDQRTHSMQYENASLISWGKIGSLRAQPCPSNPTLKRYPMQVVYMRACKKFSTVKPPQFSICAKGNNMSAKGTHDGGSLVAFTEEGPILLGLYVETEKANDKDPDVFTRVKEYHQWIIQEAETDSICVLLRPEDKFQRILPYP